MNTKPPKFFSRGQVHTFLYQSDTCFFFCVCIYAQVCKHISACACTYMRVCAHMRVCVYRCMWRPEVSVKYSSLPCFGPWSSLVWLDWLSSKSPISPFPALGLQTSANMPSFLCGCQGSWLRTLYFYGNVFATQPFKSHVKDNFCQFLRAQFWVVVGPGSLQTHLRRSWMVWRSRSV